jgi:hypothetical protein
LPFAFVLKIALLMGYFDVHFLQKTAFTPRQTYAIRAKPCQNVGTTLPKAWQESAIVVAKQVDSREKFGGINNYCYLCRYKTKKV